MAKVKVVTDSNVQLPAGTEQRLGINVIPLRIQLGKRIGREGTDFTAQNFFGKLTRSAALPEDLPPDVAELRDLYLRLHRETDQIVSVHVSSKINDACAAARAASRDLLGRCRITVVDSQTISVGLGFMVEAAAEAAAAGEKIDEIVRLVRGMTPHIYGIFFVETLDYLERGNRISKAQSILGTMLGIKPLLNVEDGEIIPLEKVHTRERAVQKLAEFVSEFARIEKMAILEHNFKAESESLVTQLNDRYPRLWVPAYNYGPSLACHLGGSAIGVIVYEGQY